MFRTRSAPELGKCRRNPLQCYRDDSVLQLSAEDDEAERLYYWAISASLPKHAFIILAKDLGRRCPDAGAYLTWLIVYRGQEWPKVAGGERQSDVVPGALLGHGLNCSGI